MVNTWYMMVYDICGMVVHPVTRILMLAIPSPINSALALIKLFKMAHIKIDESTIIKPLVEDKDEHTKPLVKDAQKTRKSNCLVVQN